MPAIADLSRHPLYAAAPPARLVNVGAVADLRRLRECLLSIERFLKRPRRFLRVLDQLENAVGRRLGGRVTADDAVERVLRNTERAIRFASPASLLGFVDKDDFLEALIAKRPLDDPGAGTDHGGCRSHGEAPALT